MVKLSVLPETAAGATPEPVEVSSFLGGDVGGFGGLDLGGRTRKDFWGEWSGVLVAETDDGSPLVS